MDDIHRSVETESPESSLLERLEHITTEDIDHRKEWLQSMVSIINAGNCDPALRLQEDNQVHNHQITDFPERLLAMEAVK